MAGVENGNDRRGRGNNRRRGGSLHVRGYDIELTTRRAEVGHAQRTIRPVLGEASVNKLSARNLETLPRRPR